MSDEETVDEYVDLDLDLDEEDARAWIILFGEDYDDLLLDGEDSVALLVDESQAREVRRVADQAIDHCRWGDLDGDD